MPFFLPRFLPELDWIQISISTHCNAGCAYCPQTVYRSRWQGRLMDTDLFAKIISRLKKVQLIYLQGWGEPFLHPDFWKMIGLVKKAGFQAGCTSNASLLDSEALRKAVDQGLDFLALSLAGLGEKNDRIRRGTSYKQVLKTIEELQRIKAQKQSAVPSLHLAYMLLRSHLQDLERLPAFFAESGADQVVLSSLTLPLSPALEKEALLADSEQEYRQIKVEMSRLFAGPELNSRVFVHFYNPFKPPGPCSENVGRALCLDPEGRVTPCVLTQVPAQLPVWYWFQGEKFELQQVDFGRMQSRGLKKIWHDPGYRRFRRRLDLELCSRCSKARIDHTLQPGDPMAG